MPTCPAPALNREGRCTRCSRGEQPPSNIPWLAPVTSATCAAASSERSESSDPDTIARLRQEARRKVGTHGGYSRLLVGPVSGQTRSRCSARHSHSAAAHRLEVRLDWAMLIVGVDVGPSVARVDFRGRRRMNVHTVDGDPRRLGSLVVEALSSARRVALAFECPLAVPIPSVLGESWTELGRARQGEGNRSWSAGAGTGALATGLVQLAWLCRYLVEHCRASPRVTTQLDYFTAAEADLLIAEAMVTSEGKPEPVNRLQDHADAVAAAKRVQEMLAGQGGDEPSSDVSCAPHIALNLTVCRFSKELSSRTAVTSADVRCLTVLSRRLSQRSVISFGTNALRSAQPRSTRRMSGLPEAVSTAQSETAGCLRDNRPCGLAGHTITLMKG
jgi:hypothetical protein